MALTGKTIASSYKDLLIINNTNSGVDSTTRNVEDGEGTASALNISDDVVTVKPNNDNTTGSFLVESSDGTDLLKVDSTNSVVYAQGNNIVNTQYKVFYGLQLNAVANTWYPLHWSGASTSVSDNLGTGSAPATTHTATYTSIPLYWYVHDDIAIDHVKVFHMGDDSASTDSLSYSLNAFTLDTTGAGAGDLSSGAVHASSSSQTIDNADMDQHDLSIGTANIDAGKVALMCVRGGSTINNDITCQVCIKYHLR